ncbi:MAG: cytochrome C [Campylobacter sp.]|nr:cytochrome C [Campylobacter sp.]
MKKAIIFSLLISCLSAGELLYPSVVKNVSLSENLKEVAGKLLPTNGVEILEKKDGVVKFAVTGYQNPKSPNIVYFTPKARILVVSFAKTKVPQFEVLGDEDGFKKVKLIAYTNDGDFSANLDEMFAEANTKFMENCGTCHPPHLGHTQVANRWPALIKSMQARTPLHQDEIWTITQFLQKHSKDFNIKEIK